VRRRPPSSPSFWIAGVRCHPDDPERGEEADGGHTSFFYGGVRKIDVFLASVFCAPENIRLPPIPPLHGDDDRRGRKRTTTKRKKKGLWDPPFPFHAPTDRKKRGKRTRTRRRRRSHDWGSRGGICVAFEPRSSMEAVETTNDDDKDKDNGGGGGGGEGKDFPSPARPSGRRWPWGWRFLVAFFFLALVVWHGKGWRTGTAGRWVCGGSNPHAPSFFFFFFFFFVLHVGGRGDEEEESGQSWTNPRKCLSCLRPTRPRPKNPTPRGAAASGS